MKLSSKIAMLIVLAGCLLFEGCATPPENVAIAPAVLRSAPVAESYIMPKVTPLLAARPQSAGKPNFDLIPTSYSSASALPGPDDTPTPPPVAENPFNAQPTPGDPIAQTVPVTPAHLTPEEAGAEMLKSLQVRPEYAMGPGDVVRIVILGDEQITGTYTVGPDGKIGVPMAGVLMFAGQTREQAADVLMKALEKKLDHPAITINITQYNNNHAYVLGRVLHPGQIPLNGEGRLLQALATAGIQPSDKGVGQSTSLPPRCAIIRGSQQVFWIDLKQMLTGGNLSLNIALRNNDLVFLPDIEEQFVYVMGSVAKPGAVPYRTKITLLDALSSAGGITTDGRYGDVIVSRKISDSDYAPPQEFNVKLLLEKGVSSGGLELNPGDVVYVRRSNMAKVGLFFQRIGPGIQLMNVGTNLFDTFYHGNQTSSTRRSTTTTTP